MIHYFQNKFCCLYLSVIFLAAIFIFMSDISMAADDSNDSYFSQLSNESNGPHLVPYKLVKTRVWPEKGCVMDSGKEIINPGEKSNLRVSKLKECDEAGIGYSLYKLSDTKNKQLLGYVSHRFRDGKFSLQVSIFCEGKQCIFRDLNPQQVFDKKE